MDRKLFVKAFNALNQARKVLLVTHLNPDGDALSSVCAMAEFLAIRKIDYEIFCHNEPPWAFSYLPQFDKIRFAETISGEKTGFSPNLSSFDLMAVFDCGSKSRTKLESHIPDKGRGLKIIEFDHHLKVDDYADIEIREDTAASTTEVLYDFFRHNGIRLNKNISTCILTGIVSDTGNFLYPSTSDKTIRIASEMLIYGANLPKIISKIIKNKSLAGMKIWGLVMSRLQINKKYNMGIALLTDEDVKDNPIDQDEIEGVSGFLSNIKGVNGILFLRELEPGKIKGSLRTSDSDLDVSKLARILGGGGHKKASGFIIPGKMIEKNGRFVIE
jgi:phosphoesterase RecJ-like protein